MLWTTMAWPIWVACLLMVVADVVHARTGKVPNRLTYTAAILGFCVAIAFGQGGVYPRLHGGIVASLGAAAITLVVLLALFLRWGLGGGSLKLHTAFAAWLGCALPFDHALFVSLMAVAAVLWGYVLARLASKYLPGLADKAGIRDAGLTQRHVSVLTVGAVVVADLMRLF